MSETNSSSQPHQVRSVPRVLVTGGATRLGREVALYFAAQNWDVAIHFNRSERQALQLQADIAQLYPHVGVTLFKAELSSDQEVKHLFEQIVAPEGSRLDCIVNNASLFEQDSGLDFTTELAIEQLKVNLMAPLKLGQYLAQFHQHKREGQTLESLSPGPSIVHVLDQKVFNLNPDYFSYTLSKLALERAVALQAQALAPGIRVNAVSPGLMFLSGEQTPENFQKASTINLLQKAIDPQDVAKSCFFLANTHSLTGATLKVDCGQHLVGLARDVMFMVED